MFFFNTPSGYVAWWAVEGGWVSSFIVGFKYFVIGTSGRRSTFQSVTLNVIILILIVKLRTNSNYRQSWTEFALFPIALDTHSLGDKLNQTLFNLLQHIDVVRNTSIYASQQLASGDIT